MGGRGCERYEPSARLRTYQVSEHDPQGVAPECGPRDVWDGAGAGGHVKESDCKARGGLDVGWETGGQCM